MKLMDKVNFYELLGQHLDERNTFNSREWVMNVTMDCHGHPTSVIGGRMSTNNNNL